MHFQISHEKKNQPSRIRYTPRIPTTNRTKTTQISPSHHSRHLLASLQHASALPQLAPLRIRHNCLDREYGSIFQIPFPRRHHCEKEVSCINLCPGTRISATDLLTLNLMILTALVKIITQETISYRHPQASNKLKLIRKLS
jgi:hypothetical protein